MSIRALSQQQKRTVQQTVLIPDPPSDSYAALVLLSRQYFSQDKTIYNNSRMQRVRRRWMKEQMLSPDSKGGLTCAICGREGLQPFTDDRNKVATLDHIVELKNNGSWNDPTNFQVACFQCNCHRK